MSVSNNLASATLAQVNAQATMVAQAVMVPKHNKHIFLENPVPGKGYRIPRVNVLLSDLSKLTRQVEMGGNPTGFHMLTGDQAIEVLGTYNPMYSGRPKKLVSLMLDAAAGRMRARFNLLPTGLFYKLPLLVGVRSTGMRLSAAGLMLLDYWSGKFPRFEAFVNAYVTKQARKQIMCDCYDLAMGYEPGWFAKEEKKNKQYQLKADSRELKRLKKEQERNAVLQKQHAALLQQQMAHQYNQHLNVYGPGSAGYGVWQQTLAGSPGHTHSVNDPGHAHGVTYPSSGYGIGSALAPSVVAKPWKSGV